MWSDGFRAIQALRQSWIGRAIALLGEQVADLGQQLNVGSRSLLWGNTLTARIHLSDLIHRGDHQEVDDSCHDQEVDDSGDDGA